MKLAVILRNVVFVLGIFSAFFIAACESSVECKDSQGNVRIWSTLNCPAYKCRGTDMICCEGAICNDVCYNDMSKLSSTEGCILPGQAMPQCTANKVWDASLNACSDIIVQKSLGCPLLEYNACFINCLHQEKRECDKATCACGDYLCQTKADCPADKCADWQCMISSLGRGKCVCGVAG